jgi:tRNA pseudouridine55 synthase
MNAILVIDKPAGITSHDVVKQVRKITGERSVGHLGTLDPMATGVLPLVLGKFTRLAQFYTSSEKEYEGTIRFGFSTDTYDAEGTPTAVVEPSLGIEEIRVAALRLTGKIRQIPPPYSAKKIAGVPAYKLARKEKPVELKAVEVEVKEFVLSELQSDSISFKACVSSGTYIRSLAHDLGQTMGCGAHLASLRRTRSGEFSLEQSTSLETLRLSASDNVDYVNQRSVAGFIHPRMVLPSLPAVTADDASLAKIRNGNSLNLPEFSRAPVIRVFASRDDLVAIARRVAGTLFHPFVVL